MGRALVSMVLLLASSDVAGAQSGRYKRDTRAIETVATPPRATKRATRKAASKPPLTADEFIQLQGKLQDIGEELIEQHIELINDTEPDHPDMPVLLFRVAELSAQKQRFLRFSRLGTKSKAKRRRLAKRENKWLIVTIHAYKRLVGDSRYAEYPRMDEAMFYYGYTLRGAGYDAQARLVFRRLVKDHPTSRFVPDAYASFADYYFENGKLDAAERFYDKVLEFPKSSVYPYAMHKKGWVQLNRKRHKEALRTFFRVAELTRSDERRANLFGQARAAFVRAYAVAGKPKLAYKAFQRLAPKRARNMLEKLGALYLAQGKAAKAIYVYHELIALAPDSQRVCEWQYTVTEAMLTAGTPKQRAEELRRLVELYRHLAKDKTLRAAALADCRDGALAKTSEIARVWHNEAVKTRDPDTLALTARLYRLYLKSFPKAADYGDMQFNLGELLWVSAEWETNRRLAAERWQRAAEHFGAVVDVGRVDAERTREAAYAAMLAWKNALDVDPRTEPPPPPTDAANAIPKPRRIPGPQSKLLAAYRVYLGLIDSKHRDYPGVVFLEGRMLWRYGHHAEAVALFAKVLDHHIAHESAPDALVLLLDSLATLRRHDEMISWIDKVSKREQFLGQHPGLVTRVDDSLVWALRRRAEQLEREGDYVACGQLYRKIWHERPAASGMDEVLYNAGVCYETGKSIGLAIYVREILVEKFPKSPLAKRALIRLGNNYGSVALYAEAAAKLEQYARNYAGQDDAPEAMSYAVAYRKGLGQDDRALKNTEFFVRKYKKKKPDLAAAALFSMTAIYQKSGKDDDIVDHLRRYLRELGNRGGIDRRIIAHAKIGEVLWRRSCQRRDANGTCAKRKRVEQEQRRGGKRRRITCSSGDRFEVVARERKLAKAARKELRTALKLWDGGKAKARVAEKDDELKRQRTATMVHWVAAAKFYLAEQEYEEFLALDFPGVKSKQQLATWKRDKDRLLVAAKTEYMKVVAIHRGGAHWAIAAAARVGQLYRTYADVLLTAEIPNKLRRGKFASDMMDTYCDDLGELTDVLETEADTGFEFCLNEATKRSWFNTWSKMCERKLSRTGIVAYTAERHDQPTALGAIVSRPAPIASLADR